MRRFAFVPNYKLGLACLPERGEVLLLLAPEARLTPVQVGIILRQNGIAARTVGHASPRFLSSPGPLPANVPHYAVFAIPSVSLRLAEKVCSLVNVDVFVSDVPSVLQGESA